MQQQSQHTMAAEGNFAWPGASEQSGSEGGGSGSGGSAKKNQDDDHWHGMGKERRAAAAILGWDEARWDDSLENPEGKLPASYSSLWDELSAGAPHARRLALSTLLFAYPVLVC